jgi:hypothetical protein
MKLKSSLLGAVAVLSLTTGAALAGYVTPPGERSGIDLASPLPEGIYFVNLAGSLGSDRRFTGAVDQTAQLNFDVPVIVWSTPWTLLGGRVELIAAAPIAEVGLHRAGVYIGGFYNPYFAAELAWNLGNGFSIGLLSGGYVPMNSGELGGAGATNHGALDEQISIAYHSNGWNATANLHDNIVFNQDTMCLSAALGGCAKNSSAFIYDLGLTKTLGKWEIGAVAFGSFTTSVTNSVANGGRVGSQSQFAMGGLVGYNFGPVITQVYLTSDLTTSGYQGGRETRLWTRVVIPLWNPEAPKVVAAKY